MQISVAAVWPWPCGPAYSPRHAWAVGLLVAGSASRCRAAGPPLAPFACHRPQLGRSHPCRAWAARAVAAAAWAAHAPKGCVAMGRPMTARVRAPPAWVSLPPHQGRNAFTTRWASLYHPRLSYCLRAWAALLMLGCLAAVGPFLFLEQILI